MRSARRDEDAAIVALLADAFTDDPLIHAVARDVPDADAARRGVFAASVATCRHQGGAILAATIDGQLMGAAIIVDPIRSRIRSSLVRVTAGVRFLGLLPVLGRRGLSLLNNADLASRALAPSNPHHVLVAVGVTAASRGHGIGRALVDAAHERAETDPRSAGLRLETENATNAATYARWGFAELGRSEVPPVTVIGMFRPTTRGRSNTK